MMVTIGNKKNQISTTLTQRIKASHLTLVHKLYPVVLNLMRYRRKAMMMGTIQVYTQIMGLEILCLGKMIC